MEMNKKCKKRCNFKRFRRKKNVLKLRNSCYVDNTSLEVVLYESFKNYFQFISKYFDILLIFPIFRYFCISSTYILSFDYPHMSPQAKTFVKLCSKY